MTLRTRYFRKILTLWTICSLAACAAQHRPTPPATDARPELYQTASLETDANEPEYSVDNPPSLPEIIDGSYQAPPPEDMGQAFSKAGSNWLYGAGLGRTITNVGTTVVFPPYGVYLLSNAGLGLAGYERFYITDAFSKGLRDNTLSVYNAVTSVPGRLCALIAGREYVRAKQ